MIFYFSATGNSRYAAEAIGESLQSDLFPMVGCGEIPYVVGSSVGFVFPVYSWGLPFPVLDFISRMKGDFADSVNSSGSYIWAVITCGDDVARAPEMLYDALLKSGIMLNAIWSLQMPNTYVLLPGFDVDSKDVEDEKLESASRRLRQIAEAIAAKSEIVDVVRGRFPSIKSRLVYPLFRRWGIKSVKWHSKDNCTGCGLCASACPIGNITMKCFDEHRRPQWGGNCCSCLACYHICPVKAAAYGDVTLKKGQYKRMLTKLRIKRGCVVIKVYGTASFF